MSRRSNSCTRPAGRISRRAIVHNEMKQGSERNTDVDTVETAFRVMTRLNGDLRWMWNKLQSKHPEGLTSLRIHKAEEPIDIKDNEDDDDINDREDDYPQFITPTLWGKAKDDTSNTMVRQLERSFLLTRRVQRVRKRERSNRS